MKVRSFQSNYSARGLLAVLWLALPLVSYGLQTGSKTVGSTEIRQAAEQFLKLHVETLRDQFNSGDGTALTIRYRVGNLDNRLAMAPCEQALTSNLKSIKQFGRISIQVRCEGPKHWSLYVPADIDLFRPVVTAVRPIARGQRISSDQLQLREMNISRLSGSYFTRMEDVLGMQAKRTVPADKTLLAEFLGPPLMIKRGETVVVTAQSNGLVVKIPGVALMDGHQGQQISVRNRQSKRIVEAIVSAPGQVTVAM